MRCRIWASVQLSFGHPVKGMALCNMLEEEVERVEGQLTLRPFEIKTLKIFY